MGRIILFVCIALFTCGFNSQSPNSRFSGSSENKPQLSAPRSAQSDDQIWKSFAQCKTTLGKDFSFSIDYTASVKAMNGKAITISGFMLPLESSEKFTHFLLSRRAPTCAFCLPGAPNEIVEVLSAKPVMWEENLVTISGTLILQTGGKTGVFFQMKNAVAR